MLILQKLYFLAVLSYIIYFTLITFKYKYNITLPNYRAFTIIFIICIICILFFLFKSNSSIVWNKTHWSDDVENYIGGKKKDLIIKEALHKTHKWKDELTTIIKQLNSESELDYKEAQNILGFIYGSDHSKPYNKDVVREILNLNRDDGILYDQEKKIDDIKKNMLKDLLKKNIFSGEDDFTINTNLLEKKVRYFTEEVKLPKFDHMFEIFGGKGIYTDDDSDREELTQDRRARGSTPATFHDPTDWGYGKGNKGGQNSGGVLREPFKKATTVLSDWMPVSFEFYDADLNYKFFETKHIVVREDYYEGEDSENENLISGPGANYNDDEYDDDRKLENLVANNFKSQWPDADDKGFANYPEWLKSIVLINLLKRRLLAKDINDDEHNRKNSLTYVNSDKAETIKEINKMFNIENDRTLRGSASRSRTGSITSRESTASTSSTSSTVSTNSLTDNQDEFQKNVNNSKNKYSKLYDIIKDDIDIDLLQGNISKVNDKLKEDYSETNYKQQKRDNQTDDYVKYFLNFSLYFGNLSFVVILSTLLIYLGNYKKKVLKDDKTEITENDKNIFNESISKQIKYTRILILIFVLIFLFSFKETTKYLSFFGKLNEGKKAVIILLILLFSFYLISSIFIINFKKGKTTLNNLFIKDLNRNSKNTKPSDRIDPSLLDQHWICYSNTCTNREDYVKKKSKNTLFTSYKECSNSGCESGVRHSGISAYKYNNN